MQSQELKKYKMPDQPGVYFFLDNNKKPIYIGKATSLRDRVRSYFGKDIIGTRGPLILDMVFKAHSIKWVETDSVLEALILEVNLIKKYQPIYNTKEKSDKSFNFVCITKDILPKVIIKRGREIHNFSACYGPYPNGAQLREAMKIIRRIFPFLDDKSKNSHEFYRQLGLSPRLDKEGVGGGNYLKNIRNIKLFFAGKKGKILKDLERDMKAYAKSHEFERAGEIKRQIFSLKHIQDVALIKEENITLEARPKEFRIEAYDIAHMSGKNMVGVMTVVEDGEVNKNEYRKFKIRNYNTANDTGALLEVLERRFSHPEWTMPKLIVIDGGKAQLNTALNFQKKVGLAIPTVSVVKDDRHKPKGFLGNKTMIQKYDRAILLANSEAHRFAIAYFRAKSRHF